MEKITTIGLDLAKHVFQVHGVDAAGKVVLKRRLRRVQVVDFFAALSPCLVGGGMAGASVTVGPAGTRAQTLRSLAP